MFKKIEHKSVVKRLSGIHREGHTLYIIKYYCSLWFAQSSHFSTSDKTGCEGWRKEPRIPGLVDCHLPSLASRCRLCWLRVCPPKEWSPFTGTLPTPLSPSSNRAQSSLVGCREGIGPWSRWESTERSTEPTPPVRRQKAPRDLLPFLAFDPCLPGQERFSKSWQLLLKKIWKIKK